MSETETIIQQLIKKGNLLNTLGLLQCASNLHSSRQITKLEFSEVIRRNYMQEELDERLKNEIEIVWKDAEDVLDNCGFLKNYSDTEIELYPISASWEKDREATRVSDLIKIRKSIQGVLGAILFMETELEKDRQQYAELLKKCQSLGHLAAFDDQKMCRICGQAIL